MPREESEYLLEAPGPSGGEWEAGVEWGLGTG